MSERRSTTMYDIHGKELFEGDFILVPYQNKAHTDKGLKEKKFLFRIVWVPTHASKTVDDTPIWSVPRWDTELVNAEKDKAEKAKYPYISWSGFFRAERV